MTVNLVQQLALCRDVFTVQLCNHPLWNICQPEIWPENIVHFYSQIKKQCTQYKDIISQILVLLAVPKTISNDILNKQENTKLQNIFYFVFFFYETKRRLLFNRIGMLQHTVYTFYLTFCLDLIASTAHAKYCTMCNVDIPWAQAGHISYIFLVIVNKFLLGFFRVSMMCVYNNKMNNIHTCMHTLRQTLAHKCIKYNIFEKILNK